MPKALKARFLIYFLFVFLGLAGLAALVFLTNPNAAPWYIFTAIYAAVFFLIFGLAAIVETVLKYSFGSQVELLKSAKTVNRQALLLGVLGSLALGFQSLRLFNPFTGILLISCLAVLELYFLNR